MKVVILAGGLGTRLAEETVIKPKPMVEIGGRPILWHIMKIYSSYGFNEFVICTGYKGYVIKEFFANYYLHTTDVTFDISKGELEIHNNKTEPWKVTLIDTGEETMTGGRLKRISQFVGGQDFCMTYGDGVSNVNIAKLVDFHRAHGKLCTVTATRPPGRFGALGLEGESVTHFQEKPLGDGGYINGGFFVVSPKCFEYIEGDSTVWEQEPMKKLAENGQMKAFLHDDFWLPMDTVRDRRQLEGLWQTGKAPWKVWE
ncbi:MAG: glucose-1-phosphate cytidylyltransferase [bacterium]